MTYKDYLKSKYWKRVRNYKLLSNEIFKKKFCSICGNKKRLEIHHLTYKNIGNEVNKTLRIVCRRCHQILSELPKPKGSGQIVKKWLKLRKQVLEIINK